MLRVFFLVVFVPLLVAGCEEAPLPESVGVDARKLELQTIDGDDYKISWRAENPIIMNIWATWCAPCVKELPSLIALDDHPDFAVLAVSIDNNPAVVKSFLMEHGFQELPVVWDKNGREIKEKIGLRGVPTTFILNTDQTIVGVEQGERDWAHPDMIEKIRAYLEQGGA